jgi:hypothetical protein
MTLIASVEENTEQVRLKHAKLNLMLEEERVAQAVDGPRSICPEARDLPQF